MAAILDNTAIVVHDLEIRKGKCLLGFVLGYGGGGGREGGGKGGKGGGGGGVP